MVFVNIFPFATRRYEYTPAGNEAIITVNVCTPAERLPRETVITSRPKTSWIVRFISLAVGKAMEITVSLVNGLGVFCSRIKDFGKTSLLSLRLFLGVGISEYPFARELRFFDAIRLPVCPVLQEKPEEKSGEEEVNSDDSADSVVIAERAKTVAGKQSRHVKNLSAVTLRPVASVTTTRTIVCRVLPLMVKL